MSSPTPELRASIKKKKPLLQILTTSTISAVTLSSLLLSNVSSISDVVDELLLGILLRQR
jgi:hypothetical protein